MSAVSALAVLLLFLLIGACQTIWLKSSWAPWLKVPIDGGYKIRGRRILGAHKTFRGFVLIIPVATLTFYGFGASLTSAWGQWQLTPTAWAWAGFAVGWGYMLGELPNSFLKRQLDIPEGEQAKPGLLRFFFNSLDESDSILGAVALGAFFLPIDALFIAVIVPTGTALHWIFNRLFIQRTTPFSSVGLYYLSFLGLSCSLLLSVHPRLSHRLIQIWTRLGLWFLGIRYTAKDPIPPETGLLLCNHSSWLDQLLLIAIAPKPLVFVAHEKYFRMPFLRWVLRCQGSVPKPERLDEARRAQTALKKAVKAGRLLVIFPEATRSESGFPLPLRGQLRHLPKDVPWEFGWISGAARCLPRSARLRDIKPGPISYRRLESKDDVRTAWVEAWIEDHIVPLQAAREAEIFGSKAAQLARHWHEAAIPEGFVLDSGITERLDDPLEPDFGERLMAVLDRWFHAHHAHEIWAVRSSALGEDGDVHSFAGQMDSVLHVRSSEDLKLAVQKVLQSRLRAKDYERLSGQSLKGCALILQKQVNAQYSGVGFTDFRQDRENFFIIEHTEGLGEDLVQGRLIPSRIRLCRSSGRVISAEGSALSELLIRSLFQLGMRLEGLGKRAIDFEWAIDRKGELFLLQARPVTQDGRMEKLLSNANMNENYPKPVTPFLYSFAAMGYQQYFMQLGLWTGVPRRILKSAAPDLKRILDIHEGRLYYDLSAVRACLGHLPGRSILIRYWDEFLGMGTLPLDLPRTQGRSALFACVFLIRLSLWMSVFPLLARRFERRVESTLKRTHGREPLQVYRLQFEAIAAIRFHGWGEAALCDAAVMIHSGIVRTLLKRALPTEQLAHGTAFLMGGSAALSMLQLHELNELRRVCQEFPKLQRLLLEEKWAVAWDHISHASRYERLRKAVQDWLQRWGSRVSGELMLTETNYQDDPILLLKLLAQPIAAGNRNVRPLPRWQLLQDCFRYGGVQAWTAGVLALAAAKPARAAIHAREACRMAQSRLYGALRANLLGVGQLLTARKLFAQVDDAFFLHVDELQDLLHECSYSHELTQQIIAQRRTVYQSYQNADIPERIGRRRGRPWFSREALPRERQTRKALDCQRFGWPASSGIVKGRVRILRSTDECESLQPGEILVTRETDPGWVVVMGRAAALVVERGGMLSHGAIVARELGIPAVIGLHDITKDLKDGMEIEVDGQRGMIQWNTSASYFAGAASVSPVSAMDHLH